MDTANFVLLIMLRRRSFFNSHMWICSEHFRHNITHWYLRACVFAVYSRRRQHTIRQNSRMVKSLIKAHRDSSSSDESGRAGHQTAIHGRRCAGHSQMREKNILRCLSCYFATIINNLTVVVLQLHATILTFTANIYTNPYTHGHIHACTRST